MRVFSPFAMLAGFIGLSEKLKRDGNQNSFVVFEDKDLVRRKRGEKKYLDCQKQTKT